MKKFYYWLDEWGRNDKMRYIFLISFLSGYSVNKIDPSFQSPTFLRLLFGFVVFLLGASIRATFYYKKHPHKNFQRKN
ncbi:hypothetical protein K5E_02270 [Enterococcus thailandicus]|uniref:hypothetical protein n=1 Tax=Enterococcus TaxID=1350 RepID=UPI000BAFC284|nr:hypothetical protein [Enterococcus thailandicus]ASZ07541.1 hypothetical protein CK496_06340 [Enterococcus thailandicus]MDA3965228.1 hypothetical protein [Enterococcus thailandicus]MDK4351117.1 hypothetical protein [Enterococcus thailandicus]MDT2733232.1 hypothetical protein [Enterococcus thailandicus]MDT2845718.1 hypothetical protein [Enterococcus thailandicus]